MEFQYLGGGQNSGQSSVGQALSQKYAPLESMLDFSKNAFTTGISEAGSNYRAQLQESGATSRYERQRMDEAKKARLTEAGAREEQIGYLTELLAEQESIINNASESGDPEQLARIPEVMANRNRIMSLIKGGASYHTLEGMLKRNADRQSMEYESAGERGALKKPQQAVQPKAPKQVDGQVKDDGKRDKASARKPISLD